MVNINSFIVIPKHTDVLFLKYVYKCEVCPYIKQVTDREVIIDIHTQIGRLSLFSLKKKRNKNKRPISYIAHLSKNKHDKISIMES